jgi:hypothetical protein
MPYLTARQIAAVWDELTARDRAVVETLRTLRLATGAQLRRLHFTGPTEAAADRAARRALARLVERRLLARLPGRIGGVRAGSAGYCYVLDVAGQTTTARRRRPRPPSAPFTDHVLAVGELYVRLHEADRAGTIELLSATAEPGCWESFPIAAGRQWVKPDLAVSLGAGALADHWFIEVDRSTESGPTLSRKAHSYLAFWRGGGRDPFPRVLVTVPDAARQTFVADVLNRLPDDAQPLFQVARFEDALSHLIPNSAC